MEAMAPIWTLQTWKPWPSSQATMAAENTLETEPKQQRPKSEPIPKRKVNSGWAERNYLTEEESESERGEEEEELGLLWVCRRGEN